MTTGEKWSVALWSLLVITLFVLSCQKKEEPRPPSDAQVVRWYTEPGPKIGEFRSCINDHGSVKCGSWTDYDEAHWWTLTHGGSLVGKVEDK